MTDRPPSPSTPTAAPAIANTGPEDRVLATTTQLTDSIETALGCRLDETVLKDLLLELDRHDYVDWVTVSRGGDHVWDPRSRLIASVTPSPLLSPNRSGRGSTSTSNSRQLEGHFSASHSYAVFERCVEIVAKTIRFSPMFSWGRVVA